MTWNKVHHISLHKPISFDMLSLVAWLDSLTTKHRHKGTDRIATVNSPAFLSMFVSDRMHHGSDAASLVNRSANVASSALLIFLKRGTSIWWTFPLCCRENSNFTLSPFSPPPPFPNHSISLTYRSLSIILTLSLSPLLFSNLVSIRMLNLERNDTYGVTKGKNGGGKKGLRPEIEWRQAAD